MNKKLVSLLLILMGVFATPPSLAKKMKIIFRRNVKQPGIILK